MIDSNFASTGVGVAGMSRTLHVVAEIAVVAAHPAFAPPAAAMPVAWAAAAVPAQRKRRTATATEASVNRGLI